MKWWIGLLVVGLIVLAAIGLQGNGTAGSPTDPVADGTAAADTTACTVTRPPTQLTEDVRETSGLAYSDGNLWTHNDRGGNPELFGFDLTGRPTARVAVSNAALVDWEDVAAGPCGEARCLFIGDIGDNDANRDHVTIYRVAEPTTDATALSADPMHVRFPEGPQDAEALFVTADGTIHIITKGEHGPIRLYRVPADASADDPVALELVSELAPAPASRGNRVTAATTTPDGEWIAFRTYDRIYFHRAEVLLGSGPPDTGVMFDLRPLGEPQGEGLAIDRDGGVWLSSEAESGGMPFITGLACPYEG